MLEFQEDARLRAVHRSSGVVDFWKVVPEQQYPNMKGAAMFVYVWDNVHLRVSVFHYEPGKVSLSLFSL